MRGNAVLVYESDQLILKLYDQHHHELTSLEVVSDVEAREFCRDHNWNYVEKL